VGQFNNWWLNRTVIADWWLPISSLQGFRPVGGFLIGTSTSIEFVPNRFEALIGGSPWLAPMDRIEVVTLGRRRLRIVSTDDAAGGRTLFTHRPNAVRRNLAALLELRPA
jgi:hypothetical protein